MGAALRRLVRLRTRVLCALAVLLAGALAGGWLVLRDSSLVAVRDVAISGVTGPEASDVRAALERTAQEMTTLHVDVERLRRAVAAYPQVKDLQAEASPLHRLRIRVVERPPVAALVAGGQRTPVAADGTLLRGRVSAGGLPLLEASTLPTGARVTDAAQREALTVLAAAPTAMRRHIERVERATDGFVAVLRDGPRVLLGDAERPRAKWVAAARVLGDAGSEGAGYIDVRLPERPAAGGFATADGTTATTTGEDSTSTVG